ncbi:MAG: class I SAM-dependent methyltransferase [Thiobacillaceae bacterium]|nr:class I SAM-dependent methyltransferase [Thiobacillaceae bacterium]MDW8323847.1 class I SAM-dependent methyltransferase [Burkholderiales bacterium]
MSRPERQGDPALHYYEADRSDLLAFIRPFGRHDHVLDIGCAGGRLGQRLIELDLARRCDGIEPHPDAARRARQRLHRVWQGRFEDTLEQVGWADYDLIILADVLEHLVDPWWALRELHRRLKPGARLLVSVPNVRHKGVLFPLLLQGRFEYTEAGILDRTHLHLFTRSSLRKLIADTGWDELACAPHIKRKYRRWWFPHRLLAEFLAVQYFLLAQK